MISLGQERRLGRKAFFLLLGRRASVGSVFFIISLILLSFGGSISKGASEGLKAMGTVSASNIQSVPSIISGFIAVCFLLSVLLILIGILVSWIEYRNYSFRFEEFNLVMKRGILNREEVSVPYRQMQDININRSLSYQLLGVSRLIIDSAGHEEKDEHNETDIILEPLDRAEAEEIRDFLQRKIGVQVVKDVKEADGESVAS